MLIGFADLSAYTSYNYYNTFIINQYLFSNQFFSTYILFAPQLYSLFALQPIDDSFRDLDTLTPKVQVKEPDSYFNITPKFLKRPDIFRENYYNFEYNNSNQNNPKGYNTYSKIDSSGSFFVNGEYLDSLELNPAYTLELDNYLEKRRDKLNKRIWDSLITVYDIKQALSQGDLARMLGQSTGIAIPVPPNPIFSIFGKPEIAINVSGEANVTLGWRWDSQNLGTVSQFGQTQSSPIFNQDIRLNVSGRIGDKLRLGTNWDTRNSYDLENKFKIGYSGYDDDIIKLVEVGNVDLPLPTTLIRGGETLFGVRADFQFGPLYLKTLFSQKRGQAKFVDVRGGATTQPFQIRAYDFAKNNFFLDTAYLAVYDKYFETSTPVIPPSADSLRIKEIEVYESTNDPVEAAKSSGNAVAHADLPAWNGSQQYSNNYKIVDIKAGEVARGQFIRLDTTRFKINYNLGTLIIRNMRQDRAYAVAYRTEGPTTSNIDDRYYGTFSYQVGVNDTFVLKLISYPNLQPGFRTLWKRQMKNIYDINARNVNVAETKINIWYINRNNDSSDVLPGAPDKLVTIFGVDQVNNGTGAAPPDGVFDMMPPFFDAVEGTITFPSSRPFDSSIVRYFRRPEVGNPDIAFEYIFSSPYDTTNDVARQNTARDRFVISGEVSGRQSNRINLGAFNLARNSVRVTLDGVPLIENQDYVVDYYAGTLTMKNPRASLPGANLKVEYEQRDIFNIATKTLAGIRGDYDLFTTRTAKAYLGFTLMHYDQSAIVDRVRLGEEPISNTMFGLDGNLNWDAQWLTKALDALPFYDTKAQSNITLKGEWALMMPTPNKRSSEIASDNGEPVVFIDDFDGSQRNISLGLNAAQWQHSSQHVDSTKWASDSVANLHRGKLFWWQFFIPRVPVQEVYPENESYIQGRNFLNPMYLVFAPDTRGIYNQNPEYLDTLNPQYNSTDVWQLRDTVQPKIWGGMQRLLSSFTTNFDTENIEFLEVTMRIHDRDEGKTKFYIDLGQISEDIIPNKSTNTEDGITEANPLPNGIIDVNEDVGIDAIANAKEKETYPYPLNLEVDPARDDYMFEFGKDDRKRNPLDFYKYNNFEGNATVSELGQYPDTEVLNSNNGQVISQDNSYFTYELQTARWDWEVANNPQIVGGNPEQGWYIYRIPIRKPSSKTGNPLFSNINYARIRIQGGKFAGEIVDWKLVGSQWQRVSTLQSNPDPNDSVLSISFVNLYENSKSPDFYTSPPGVQPPRQLNNPDPTQDIRMNEQSIAIGVKNLRYGDERMATRIFRPLDLFFYKKLKFFIHGDGAMPDIIVPGAVPKAYAFIRFGIDSGNYYEYRRPLTRGWQDIEIDLSQLTAIKQARDTSITRERQIFPVPNDPDAVFAIKGYPILTRVQFFGVGIFNPAERFPNELTTRMWVNELRLITPEESSDWAGLGNVSVTLADLGRINANFETSQPNFHQLEERFGLRMNSTKWSFTAEGNLEKFAPKSFSGMKLPIAYTHSEIMDNPLYVANNDILLNEAATTAYNNAIAEGKTTVEAAEARDNVLNRSQTMRVQDMWSITGVKLGLPSDFILIKELLNKLTLGYSYSQEYERSPVYEERFNWVWRFTLQYGLAIPELLAISPLGFLEGVPILGAYSKWKINFLPSNINTDFNLTRRRQTEQSRYLEYPSPVMRDFSAIRKASLNWKLSEGGLLSPIIDYTFTTNSTLVPFEIDEFGRQRTGSEIAALMFFKNGKFVDFGQNTLHLQTVTMNFKPTLPDFWGTSKYFDITGSFNTSYNWSDPLQRDPEIRDIVKVASFNNNIRFNMSFRLKSLGEEWFGITQESPKPKIFGGPGPTKDTTSKSISEGFNIFKTIKSTLMDWEKIDFTFTQTNSSLNPGVFGGTGMDNFWGRGLTFRESLNENGPSFAYQLGLIDHPHGGFGIVPSAAFPFFRFETSIGLRPPNARLQDNFRQQSALEANTSRPLWTGATLELKWKTDVGYNRNQTVVTDANGNPTFTNVMGTESYNRTFFTFPSIFGWNPFNNTVDNVVRLYELQKVGIDQRFNNGEINQVQKNALYQTALSNSFYEGLEAFSIFGGDVGKFLPSVNWTLRWEGLEKFSWWDKLVKRMTFEHSYQSQYQEQATITDNGKSIQTQSAQYGFQPLIGFNANFDEKRLDGNLNVTLKWSSTKQYSLNNAAGATISSQATDDITAQASYTMRGFEFPLFGINLKNDFELSFLFTYKVNKQFTFNVEEPQGTYTGDKAQGRTLNGNTQIIIEPRARYTLSKILTAAFFVRYEGTFNEGAAQPGFHTTQVGLELRISLSGGR